MNSDNKIAKIVIAIMAVIFILLIIELKRAAFLIILPILIFAVGIWLFASSISLYLDDRKKKDQKDE